MDTNNYNYYEEEEEISLVDLIAYVFRHLKKMLIVSIVVALVVGGLLGYKKSRNNVVNNDIDTFLVSKESFDKKLEETNEELNNFLINNDFFGLTPYNSVQARALYYVDVDSDADYVASLIKTYIAKLTSSDVLTEIAKKYNISEVYVSDYISIYSHISNNQVDKDNNLIDINVYYSDEEVANSILNDLEGKLLSYNNELSSSIGTNKLTLVSENVYKGFNNNVVSVQKDKINYINGLVTSITDIQKQLNSLYTSESTNNVSFKKVFVKYGVIGFVGMSFAMCVYYALAFIFSDKVYSANEFKDKTKIKVVGNLTFSKNNDKYINWINKLEKRPTINDYELIASNIKAYGNTNKVLLSGNLEDSIKEDIVSNLKKLLKNVEIISCGSLLTDSNAVNELDSVDSVILLAKCNKSSYKTIKEEKNKLDDLKVTNVYAIVVE
ncbi:MAG: hypothetical protein PT938_09025 [Solobacterium sp.]|nr:hypothetical protein [Solobacterium sp.]MDD7776883.1 hypothetical protein [Solobacterium sp.]